MEVEEAIAEISRVHGFTPGRDDPILVLVTLNEMLLKRNTAAQDEMLGKFKSELEDLSMRWSEDTKKKAERIITIALTTAQERIESESKRVAQEFKASVQMQIGKQLAEFRQTTENLKSLLLASIGLTGVLGVTLASLVLFR